MTAAARRRRSQPRPEASARRRKYADLGERVVATFLMAFASTFVATGTDDLLLSLKVAGGAGLLSAAKCVASWGLGNGATSSALPANLDPATPPGQR